MSRRDERPPLSFPGSRKHSRARMRQRKRLLLYASAGWMLIWFPLFMVVGPAFHGLAGLGLALVAVVSYLALTVWIGFSSRFTQPVVQHSVTAVGVRERTLTYRHVGGTHLVASRIVTDDHYRECAVCGVEFVDGVREDWARQVVGFGVPLVTLASETTFYCMECRPEAWGEAAPSLPTCDLKNPERSDVSAAMFDAE